MTLTAARTASDRFSAMGTDATVTVVDGPVEVLTQARARLGALEHRWSRFHRGSDVSALNHGAGSWVPVAPETLLLLERAVQGARATAGRYDPTVGGALIAHGYDRTFADVPDAARGLRPVPVIDGSWPAIEVDRSRGTACLPAGTVFDPGGIGKGLAADLVVEELADQAGGLLVNLGGDLRMQGSLDPEGWVVAIEDPFRPDAELGRFAVPRGAVATSSRLRRRWSTAGGEVHHVIDPRTGRPAATGIATATVVAAEAWWAEVQATAVFLAGPDALADADPSIRAAVVLDDGTVRTTPDFDWSPA